MKKKLIILIVMFILLLAFSFMCVYNIRQVTLKVKEHNNYYESYYNKEIFGTDLISLINKTMDYNTKNDVEVDSDSIYFKDNLKNSIKIDIKFLESKNTNTMEEIAKKKSENFVKFFANSKFKCKEIKYHKETKNIKYLYFEQI